MDTNTNAAADGLRPLITEAMTVIYRIAEGLYGMHGVNIPDGRTFARSIDETAERCYNMAVVVYHNWACGEIEQPS